MNLKQRNKLGLKLIVYYVALVAFLVLRAQERGLSVVGILGMLITFTLVYTQVSAPAGSLSDRIGRRKVIVGGWLAYAAMFRALRDRLGFSKVRSAMTGGAALGPDVFRFFHALGVNLKQIYGQTEVAGARQGDGRLHGLDFNGGAEISLSDCQMQQRRHFIQVGHIEGKFGIQIGLGRPTL